MTAVIGLLNKLGVALAADSAATITHGDKRKYTKNESKLIRMSNALPISVMTTGNGEFIRNPWDVVIRQYRRERGDIKHSTVEDCVHDFFDYISKNNIFWDEEYINSWVKEELEKIFDFVNENIENQKCLRKIDTSYNYLKTFLEELNKWKTDILSSDISPQFKDYTLERFVEYAEPVITDYFNDAAEAEELKSYTEDPIKFLKSVRSLVEQTLMASLTTRSERNGCAELVFSGYGEEQEYPSLVSAIVYEGFDQKVNYHIRPEDIICINDERPVAFCPFAQADVTKSIIKGVHRSWGKHLLKYIMGKYKDAALEIFSQKCENPDLEFMNKLDEVKFDDLIDQYWNAINQSLNENQQEWEKTLEQYDLKSMAALAESLIDLTGFQRILTFQEEGVGGPVDVAVITKNDGFKWLSRKSWYHHKNVNGMYGSLGI